MKVRYLLYGIFIALILLAFWWYKQLYKAGNLIDLKYPVETSLDANIVSNYIDTLKQKYGYAVPEKWIGERKLDDLDSINHKRIYFKNHPEEMYVISFGGMILISDVYNQRISKHGWVAVRDSMPPLEEKRVKERFQREILDKIVAMAKKDGIPDSVLYYRPKF